MGTKRDIINLLSVFDLTICKAISLPERVHTRVVLVYDNKKGIKEYRLLNNKIPKEVNSKIILWLKKNIDLNHVTHNLNPKKIDADKLIPVPERMSLLKNTVGSCHSLKPNSPLEGQTDYIESRK